MVFKNLQVRTLLEIVQCGENGIAYISKYILVYSLWMNPHWRVYQANLNQLYIVDVF